MRGWTGIDNLYKGTGTESPVVKGEGTGSEGNGNRKMKARVKKYMLL